MREAHVIFGGVDDVASMSMIENWIDEAEQRVWFLFECGRRGVSCCKRGASVTSARL
jgi:hypothetical protein